MSTAPRESDALAALERLYRRNVVSLEQAQAAARLITGDPSAPFPPPAPPAAEPGANGGAPPEDAPPGSP